jgi:hypothetical protein
VVWRYLEPTGRRGTLNIGTIPTSSKYCLRAFLSTFPGCHVSRPFGLPFHLTQPSLSG